MEPPIPIPIPALVPTDYFREKVRIYSRHQREILRAAASDALRFGLGEIKLKVQELDDLCEKDVKGLAVRIKRRKHATEEDMYRLCHAFLQGESNIVAFANAAAIPVIVKELTGHDATRQICAAECLCNLSLGPTAVCDKIVNMSGSYLVTYIDSMDEKLKRTCLWVLANIIATGGKGATALIQMELVPKLWPLYTADNDKTPVDYRDDAGLILQLISLQAKKLLRSSDYMFIREHMMNKNPTCVAGEYHLQIIFNCEIVGPDVAQLNDSSISYLINYSISNLIHTADYVSPSNRLKILYAVRILANLLATQSSTYALLLQHLSNIWQISLTEFLNRIFTFGDSELNTELLWLLRNILQCLEQQQTTLLNSVSLLEKLRIPKMSDAI